MWWCGKLNLIGGEAEKLRRRREREKACRAAETAWEEEEQLL